MTAQEIALSKAQREVRIRKFNLEYQRGLVAGFTIAGVPMDYDAALDLAKKLEVAAVDLHKAEVVVRILTQAIAEKELLDTLKKEVDSIHGSVGEQFTQRGFKDE